MPPQTTQRFWMRGEWRENCSNVSFKTLYAMMERSPQDETEHGSAKKHRKTSVFMSKECFLNLTNISTSHMAENATFRKRSNSKNPTRKCCVCVLDQISDVVVFKHTYSYLFYKKKFKMTRHIFTRYFFKWPFSVIASCFDAWSRCLDNIRTARRGDLFLTSRCFIGIFPRAGSCIDSLVADFNRIKQMAHPVFGNAHQLILFCLNWVGTFKLQAFRVDFISHRFSPQSAWQTRINGA